MRRGKLVEYMDKLLHHFNPLTLDNLMCRSLVSVDWNGYLYDCDFNQMLDLSLVDKDQRRHISNVTDEILIGSPIQTANHCFGCTAGCGSSCTGSLA